MSNKLWNWVIAVGLISLLSVILEKYLMGTVVTVLSFIGGISGIAVIVGLIVASRRGYLNRRPWLIHFENRSEKPPLNSDKLRLYPGKNTVFVQVLTKVPLDYSLATILIGLKPRRKALLMLWPHISLYKRGVFRNYRKRTLFKAWFSAPLRNPPPNFFVQLRNVDDKSPLRERLGITFIPERSSETGITWFLGYKPSYNVPAGSPIWLYLDIEVGAIPKPTSDFDERREALGIEFKSGVAGQRRPIFREIKFINTPDN
jgi:hypothetical protein